MISRIEVRDFQSLGKADIELGKLTVICGRGNTGKSALIRALQSALFNSTGAGNIRVGEKETSVKLHFDGGPVVLWKKDSKTARYEVFKDGIAVPYTKLAGGVPTEIETIFGIREVEIDKTFSITPQIHSQFDSPLLLAESSGKAARALAKLTKLQIIVQAQMSAARDLRREKQDATAREREVKELGQRIDEMPAVASYEKPLLKARTLLESVDDRLSHLAEAEEVFDLSQEAGKRWDITLQSEEIFEELTERIDLLQNSLLARKVRLQAQEGVDLSRMAWKRAEADVIDAEGALESFLAELDVCPICGQPMGEEHLDEVAL